MAYDQETTDLTLDASKGVSRNSVCASRGSGVGEVGYPGGAPVAQPGKSHASGSRPTAMSMKFRGWMA